MSHSRDLYRNDKTGESWRVHFNSDFSGMASVCYTKKGTEAVTEFQIPASFLVAAAQIVTDYQEDEFEDIQEGLGGTVASLFKTLHKDVMR